MNALTLAGRQLMRRPVQSAVNAVIMGLGIGMVTLLLLAQEQFEERLKRDARGIDLVVGAPGSPMQIILSSVYHVDIPTGNIPLNEARDIIEREAAVDRVIPLALGDNYEGHRIVGTEPAYADHYGAVLAGGRIWNESMEAVLGAEVARDTGLDVGDRFAGAHGLGSGGHVHDYAPYAVVGVFEHTGSVLDRLILAPVESVWDVHEPAHDHGHGGAGGDGNDGLQERDPEHTHGHDDGDDHDERGYAADSRITALLVRYASPIAASRLPREIDENTPWQSAEPAFETARLAMLIAPAVTGLRIFGGLLILASLLSVFGALYQSLRDRRYDFAVMRAIGATPAHVFRLTLIEGLLMVGTGLATGVVLGHAATGLTGSLTAEGRALGLTGLAWGARETGLVLGVLTAGLAVSLVPAWLAARSEAATTLRQGY